MDAIEYQKKYGRITCCPNNICNNATSRPKDAPTCKCGRFCGTCGRYNYILLPFIPPAPIGIMTKITDLEKLNWIKQDNQEIALFPASFWDLWKKFKHDIIGDIHEYQVKKIGTKWIITRKIIEYGSINLKRLKK